MATLPVCPGAPGSLYSLLTCPCLQPCPDCEALLAFKASFTNGDTVLSGWDPANGQPCGTSVWAPSGVLTCEERSGASRVVAL